MLPLNNLYNDDVVYQKRLGVTGSMRWITPAVVIVLVTMVVGGGLPPVRAAPKVAPPFTLELFRGEPLSLAALKGSAVILLFWAPW